MQSGARKIVILGTGGTIAGTAASPADAVGYTSAQLGVAQLVAAVPALANADLESEQVAQVDSKDMGEAIWLALARRAAFHLARPEVAGLVVTHGTDTLEETAYFLHRVLAPPSKPIVLTAAMRPATSSQADGPQNLLDAVAVASAPGARGVVAVLAGAVFAACDLRKRHTQRVDAFGAGEAGVVARIEDGRVHPQRDWPQGNATGLELLAEPPWPVVEIITSHAGSSDALVRAALATGARGIVVAATGNGTVHHTLLEALCEAQRAGVTVWRSTRWLDGPLLPRPDDVLPSAGGLTPVQARIELQLQLMGAAPAR